MDVDDRDESYGKIVTLHKQTKLLGKCGMFRYFVPGGVLILLMALFLACGGAATPTPAPTAQPFTPAPTATPALRPTMPPVSPVKPTPTAAAERLDPIECVGAGCQTDYEPVIGLVDWVQKPQISEGGRFSFIARIDDGYDLTIPGLGGGPANVVFSVGSALYGTILPPSGPGWDWTPSPNQWIADTYEYAGQTLTVAARVSPAVATHPGLRICLWTGGPMAKILDCTGIN